MTDLKRRIERLERAQAPAPAEPYHERIEDTVAWVASVLSGDDVPAEVVAETIDRDNSPTGRWLKEQLAECGREELTRR